MSSNEWRAYVLGDLCQITSSKRIFSEEYVNYGVPFYRSKEVIEKALGEDVTENYYISRERFEEIRKGFGSPKSGDVLISSVGNRSGIPYLVKEDDGDFYFKDGNLIWFRNFNEKIDSKYLSFWLKSTSGQNALNSIMIGSAQKALTIEGVSSLSITLPDTPAQKIISNILSSLDDKIELNRRMNRTLESMARAVFSEMMNDEGGKMKVEKLGDICEFSYGKALKADGRNMGEIPVYGSNGQIGWHDEYLVKGPGIVVGRKGNPGIVTWAQNDFFPIDTTFYVVSKKSKTSLYWLYYILISLNLRDLGADSAVPGLNRNIAYMSDVNYLSHDLMNRFDDFVIPLFDKIYANEKESRTLASLRDSLLPKLMRGEVRVKDVEG